MKRIAVYAPSCMKYRKTEEVVRLAVEEADIEATSNHVSDIQAIAAAGLLSTLAVAVDGSVS